MAAENAVDADTAPREYVWETIFSHTAKGKDKRDCRLDHRALGPAAKLQARGESKELRKELRYERKALAGRYYQFFLGDTQPSGATYAAKSKSSHRTDAGDERPLLFVVERRLMSTT